MPYTKTTSAAAAAILALAWAIPAAAQDAAPASPAAPEAAAADDPERVVARVGDEAITVRDLQQAAEDFAEQLARAPAGQRPALLLNVLIDMKLLAKAAREKGLDKSPEFTERLELLTTRALRNTYVRQAIVDTITEEELRAEYEEQIKSFQPREEVRARHILVASKEEADAIVKALEGGAEFGVLAEEKSIDPSAKGRGGELGWFGRGQMVGPFEEAAFALEPGSYTKEPVQTQFGWHVIGVEEKRMSAPPPFEEVKEQVRNILIGKKFQAEMDALKARYPVEIVGAPAPGASAPADGSAAPADGSAPPPAASDPAPAATPPAN